MLTTHLAYGMLEEQYKSQFANSLEAAAMQDHHWRLYAPWMMTKFSEDLATKLDNQIYVALSCLDPLPTLVMVSRYVRSKSPLATENLLENTDGVLSGRQPATFLFMLTAALLMTSSHSEGTPA